MFRTLAHCHHPWDETKFQTLEIRSRETVYESWFHNQALLNTRSLPAFVIENYLFRFPHKKALGVSWVRWPQERMLADTAADTHITLLLSMQTATRMCMHPVVVHKLLDLLLPIACVDVCMYLRRRHNYDYLLCMYLWRRHQSLWYVTDHVDQH